MKERMFGEYELQKATVVLFPYREDIWRKKCVPAERMIVALANAIAPFQQVILGVVEQKEDYLKSTYSLHPNVRVVVMKYNDIWTRDTIGSPVTTGTETFIPDFRFNAYGAGLYRPWNADDSMDAQIAELFGYGVRSSVVTTEGGNLMPDGNGTIFAIKESLANKNRNPDLSEEEIIVEIKKITGAERVVWVPQAMVMDETGGHVDNVLAFADKRTMFLSYTDDESNDHYAACQENYKFLSGLNNLDGDPYRIVKLPIPPLAMRSGEDCDEIVTRDGSFARLEGDAILRTYVNFAQVNGGIILPQFGIDMDKEAFDIIQEVFKDRTIVPFDSREAALGGGGLHCLTKNIN